MNLSPAQLVTLKTHLANNNNTIAIPSGSGNMVAIKDIINPDNAVDVAAWYNLLPSPDYWGWRSKVTRSEVYHQSGINAADGVTTTWDWATYKGQAEREQNAFTQMFMGDEAPAALLNFRKGIFAIFSGSAPQNLQRNHIFGVCRRKLTNGEKVFSAVVTGTGISVDNGNETGQARGSLRNPDVLGSYINSNNQTIWAEGTITEANIKAAWAAS